MTTIERVVSRQDEVDGLIATAGEEPKTFIHPAMASRYHAEIRLMIHALKNGQSGEATEHVRALIEKIVLTPANDNEAGLQIDLHGDLAGILKIASENTSMNRAGNEKRPIDGTANGSAIYRPSVQMVAGAGCQRYLSY